MVFGGLVDMRSLWMARIVSFTLMLVLVASVASGEPMGEPIISSINPTLIEGLDRVITVTGSGFVGPLSYMIRLRSFLFSPYYDMDPGVDVWRLVAVTQPV
jgi:hypothetical protein